MNTVRKQILEALDELSILAPDVRLGQLIVNLSYLALGPTVEAPRDVEDEQLLDAIRRQIVDLSKRTLVEAV